MRLGNSWKKHLVQTLLGRVLPDKAAIHSYLRNVLIAVGAAAAGGLLAAFALAGAGVAFYYTLLQYGLSIAGSLWICALLGLAVAACLLAAAFRAFTHISPLTHPCIPPAAEATQQAASRTARQARRAAREASRGIEEVTADIKDTSQSLFASAKALTSGFLEGLREVPLEEETAGLADKLFRKARSAADKAEASMVAEPPNRTMKNRQRFFETE